MSTVEVIQRTQQIIVSPADGSISVINAGPPGPPGPAGPAGLSGGSYTHTQSAASSTWIILHNLGFKPSINTFNSYNEEVEGDVQHDSNNQLTITFAYQVSGFALLS